MTSTVAANNNNTNNTQETQKILLLKKYKRGLKSEEKKKLFHQSLTNYNISKRLPRCTVKPSLIFCTPEKTKILEKFFQGLLKRRSKPVETEQVLHVLSKITCSVRKECDLSHALYDIVMNVNKISFVARLKALKKRIIMADKKLLISLLVSLTKKNSLLKFAIHFMIDNFICITEHRRLCSLMLGLLYMDPHMWSRSLVMLECVRTTFEQLMIRFLLKTGRNPHRYITCNIDNYLSMYRTAGVNMAFMNNSYGTVSGVAPTPDMCNPAHVLPPPPSYPEYPLIPAASDPYALHDHPVDPNTSSIIAMTDPYDDPLISSTAASDVASLENNTTNTVFV
ncbi:protein U13.5 [Elephant endotheliotropic herpesvirus 1A]|uniref:Protein U13.5 n=2 Tax=Elephantid herpesvirus 1 TaxID=146015 RepID=M1RMB2_ELHV1|nr:protein UL34 [Elephantid betaherpesvirus 1]AGG16059.1 protein U13.5 [Elephant endotheliotropic herpesvirus 1A]AGE10019.1 protein UL34 [Elephantid betaherpesvirus 1]QOE74567.1 protein U13.5 [Elephant endotheliotropic herpesvirus 1A]QOE74804.1 protein U13.5 [Elephant endotheliotropic herpesvirus 1A]QOE74920.1 protein U13.5 [Elephant endotheliotropic herpesvirus 1A]